VSTANKGRNIYLFFVSNNRLWPSFPNSLLSLCNPLIDAGYNPRIIDTELEGLSDIVLEDPLLAGFSVYTDANIAKALKIAAMVRQRYPAVPLVWGGPHAIMMPDQTARHPLVDFVCYGEGEIPIVELARSLSDGSRSFENVRGIIWKDKRGLCVKNAPSEYVDLDRLKVYPYDVLNQQLYHLSRGKVYYEASRGCTYSCRFCSYDHRKWRYRSAELVIEDLTKIDEKFSPQEIQVLDANHFMKPDWVNQIWSEKSDRGLLFRWETNCRFDTLVRMDEKLLDTIAKAGCYQLRLGAESGSQKILDYLNKGITVDQILIGIRRCLEHKINPLVSFMIGYPHEDDRDIEATVALINTIRRDFPGAQINGLFQFQPYPNTKIFQEIRKDYQIPQPAGLDGWSRYQIVEMHRSDFPWLDNRRYKRYQLLNSIVSYIFFADKLKSMPYQQRCSIPLLKNRLFFGIFTLCDKLFRDCFIRLRWDKRIFVLPIEWYIWNFVRKHILKLF
jgi:anaerobic magnesium-protoporphyrin IX monomethyl ester cyclase